MILSLGTSVYLFGDSSSSGPNQIALLFSVAVVILIGMKNGHSWESMEKGMLNGIQLSLKPILILFLVGALIGVWILSGTVPYLILLGMNIISPDWFYAAVCLICAIVSLCIGSSWTVAGTIGIAAIGAAQALDLSLSITAGAIISGAYFGDKMSPLSDSTNLTAAATETNLFDHIKHMMWTSIPAILIALIGYSLIPGADGASSTTQMQELTTNLNALFDLSIWCLLPPLVLLLMSLRRLPPLPTLTAGLVAGILVILILQPDASRSNAPAGSELALLTGLWVSMFDGYTAEVTHVASRDLLHRGGMISMLNTVWLIICAMAFGGVMEASGILQKLINSMLKSVRGVTGLIVSTMGTSFATNILAADQYIAIVMPGRIYSKPFNDAGLKSQNLSRALEDSGTMTSALIPWNTCGAFMATTLGVATLAYLPFCFFNLLSPLISIIYAVTGYTILKIKKQSLDSYTHASQPSS